MSKETTNGWCCDWMDYAFELGAVFIGPMQSNPEREVPMMVLNIKAKPPFTIQKIVKHCPECGEPLRDRTK